METEIHMHRSNDIVSGTLHLVGALLAIAILVLLLVFGTRYGSAWHVVGFSIFGTGLLLLYGASAIYHLIPQHHSLAKHVFQRIDHAMIFVLIAGTYTPVTLLALTPAWGWTLFGIVWGLAVVGITMKLLWIRVPGIVSVLLYIVMGWIIVIAFSSLREHMSTSGMWFLFWGGVSYSLGVVFFALDNHLPRREYLWMHEIFHLFVLGGSALHTVVMFSLI